MRVATITLIVVLSVCCGGAIAQCNTHTQTCVQDSVTRLLFILRNNILRADIEDQNFNFAFIDISFTNIRIQALSIGRVTARDTGSQIILTMNDISFRLTADWTRRRAFRTRRGTIDATASDSSFTFTYNKSAVCPRGEAFICNGDINNYNFQIRGRLFGIIPRRRAPGAFRQQIIRQFCAAGQSFLTLIFPIIRC